MGAGVTPEQLREAIALKLSLSRTPVKKYESIRDKTAADNRTRGVLLYHGAKTGRWASTGVNMQNIPRGSFEDTDGCIALFHTRDPDVIYRAYGDPVEALSTCIRGMVKASDGHYFIVSDYSAIEARVLAWVAGQEDVLDVFRGHGKIYEHTASQIYGVPIDDITKEQRFIGKTATLALGYQGGPRAFQLMADNYGVDIDEALAEEVKAKWRDANYNIVTFWWKLENASLAAIRKPGTWFKAESVLVSADDQFLMIQLPSSRRIYYYHPSIEPGTFDKDQVHFWGVNSLTRKWEKQNTFGGRLCENVVQGIARDVMAHAMLKLEAAGYPIVLSVHDELVSEVPEGFGSLEEFNQIMATVPEWAPGLPLAAAGWSGLRYRK